MCRFIVYLGPQIGLHKLLTDPENSLIEQSIHAKYRREPLNGDGFGLAVYVPEVSDEPALFRSVQPAWNNTNLRQFCRITRTSAIMAHVRAATPDLPVAEVNCHPFVGGRFAFMHNGEIGGFRRIKRRIQQRLSDEAFDGLLGSTDSEHAFALFRDRLKGQGGGLEAMKTAMLEVIAELEELRREIAPETSSYLNFAVTDGDLAVVSRYGSNSEETASLFVDVGRKYECKGGVCRMIPSADGEPSAAIVSSEPLSKDPGWRQVPSQHLVLVDADRNVTMEPIEL